MRDHLQALLADRLAAGRALAVGALLDTVQGRIDLRNFQEGGAFKPFEDFVGFGLGRLLH